MKCLLEALVVERLHEIVDGREIERRERVLVVRRHEHGRRHVGRSDGAHDFEPGHAGHLHVEKYEIGRQRSNRFDRRNAVADHADDLDAAFLSHQARHAPPAEGLVIDYQHAQRRAAQTLRALRRWGVV